MEIMESSCFYRLKTEFMLKAKKKQTSLEEFELTLKAFI